MVEDKCPGLHATPIAYYTNCPKCGTEVEIWSNEQSTKCPKCGTIVQREKVPPK